MIASFPDDRVVASKVAVWIAAATVCFAFASVRIAQAQSQWADDFKAYPVHRAKVTDVEATLANVLPPGSQIAADTQTNQIWVRGSTQAHQIAQNTISSIDRPAQQESGPALSPPVLKNYTARPGEAAPLAARWNAEFGNTPGVRIVADERTSQVLVVAPPEIHAAIARGPVTDRATPLVAPAGTQPYPAVGPPAAPVAPQLAPATPVAGYREVILRQSAADRIEYLMAEMLGQRFVPLGSPTPGTTAYRLQLADRGGALTITLDRRANRVRIEGPQAAAASCAQLVSLLDASPQSPAEMTRVVPLNGVRPADMQRTIEAIRAGNVVRSPQPDSGAARPSGAASLVSTLYQPAESGAAGAQGAATPPPAATPQAPSGDEGGLIGPVEIEHLEGTDMLVIKGSQRDVEKVIQMIRQIEQLSVETEPSIEVYPLRQANCVALAELVKQLYADVFAPRQGSVSITALVKPNALLLIGRPESVTTVIDLVKRLDVPVRPETQFRVFRLQHAAAQNAAAMIQGLYQAEQGEEERPGLAARVVVTADVRSNSLIAQAGPRDMQEVAEMIVRIDTPTSDAVNELRLFQLKNTLATDLVQTLQGAISAAAGPAAGAAASAVPTGAPGAEAPTATTGGGQQRSTTLRFLTVDVEGKQQLRSGILSDVQITADARANTLLVSAPAETMPLLDALIRRLDQPPVAEAEVKVFTIVNGDAGTLREMLEGLFGQQPAAGEPGVRTAATAGETSLVPLRFAVDQRTNSIIASGTVGDLSVVEAILLRLDESDVRKRRSTVIRLKNSFAPDVAEAINDYLTDEQDAAQVTTDLLNPFEQVDRRVVVVPEQVSNSLIVSATPEYYEEILALVEKLDSRPPMVMIQVLIASVNLNNTDEFGVELGLQDSILFDRSLLGDLQKTTTSTQTPQGNTVVTTTQEIIQAATNTPGFLFNNQQLGNSGADKALLNPSRVGTQGLAHFDVGRINNELGYGGLVLAASSESVSMLVRALKESRRLEVLSRPQVMTLDNQPAFILVGERVPRVIGTSTTEAGLIQNQITLEDVGLILGVTPRISPDGLVVMEIDATSSELGAESEGIPISIAPNGDAIRSPRINTIQVQTTASAVDGQTVVLGGLITKSKNEVKRRVPYLSDIPVLGNLFRYDLDEGRRDELLIILTPHIVENEEDAMRVRQAEVARIHWCLSDVLELTGDGSLRGRSDEWRDSETSVIYPDGAPLPEDGPAVDPQSELVPSPDGYPSLVDPAANVPKSDGGNGAFSQTGGSRNLQQAGWWSEQPIRTTPLPAVSSPRPATALGPYPSADPENPR